jgi:hypothetical protein
MESTVVKKSNKNGNHSCKRLIRMESTVVKKLAWVRKLPWWKGILHTLIPRRQTVSFIPHINTVHQFTCARHMLRHHTVYPLGDWDWDRWRHWCCRCMTSTMIVISFTAAITSCTANTTRGGRRGGHRWRCTTMSRKYTGCH